MACHGCARALFELMVKSMVEYLHWSGAHEAPRKARFPDQFTDDLATLVSNVTAEIISKWALLLSFISRYFTITLFSL